MPQTADAFLAACDREGLKYLPPETTADGRRVIRLRVKGSHGNSFTVTYIFSPEGRDVSIRIFGLVTARREILHPVLHRCNLMNNRFRWVKFTLDEDWDLNLEADCILLPETAGDVCLDMLYRLVRTADAAYPQILSHYGSLNPDPGFM